MSLRRGTIRGVVLDAASREPIDDARVLLWHEETEWGEEGRPQALSSQYGYGRGLVEPDGTFVIEDIRAGSATLVVCAPDYGMTTRGGIPVRSGEVTDMELLLAAAGTLRVNIAYTGYLEGRKAELWMHCYPAEETPARCQLTPGMQGILEEGAPGPTSSLAETGTYEMSLQPGAYDVFVHVRPSVTDGSMRVASRNGRTVQAQVESGRTTTVDVEFGGSGTIEGDAPPREDVVRMRLVLTPGEDTSAIEATSDLGRQLEQILATYGEVYVGSLDREYRYLLSCVPAGAYTLTLLAQHESDGVWHIEDSRAVQVAPDQVVTVDFP